MYHCYKISGRSCYKVNFFVRLCQVFLKYCHCKYTCSGRYISCADSNAVCCNHSCSSISFRRTHWNLGLKCSCRIKQFCAFFCQYTCVFSGNKNFRKDFTDLPWEILLCCKFIKLIHHLLIKFLSSYVDWEHSCCITISEHLLAGQFPMDISCKCCNITNIFYMFFTI